MPDTENPLDSRLVELAERVEATVARTQRLEATVATLVENLEGMTSGVEEAFSVLQSGMSGLAMDLARMETTIVDLAASTAEPAADPALTARIDDLWKLVHELSDRPLVDADARERADELAARLEVLADRASLEQVEGSLDGLRSSLDDLGDLRAAVAELETRPAGSPELDARLERLEARLNEYGAAAADTTAVESLTGRLDAALATQSALEASLGAIDERLELLAQDLASRADASLAEHVATVEGRLGGLVSGEDLSLALERTREELASMPPESDPRIDELAREVTSVRDELHEATAARLDAVEARLQAELAASTDPEAAKALAALSERIEELSRDRHHQEELAVRLDGIESHLPTDTVSTVELTAALERTREELAPKPQEPDPRVDDLARELASVRDELHQEEAASRLEAIEARLEAGLASSTDPRRRRPSPLSPSASRSSPAIGMPTTSSRPGSTPSTAGSRVPSPARSSRAPSSARARSSRPRRRSRIPASRRRQRGWRRSKHGWRQDSPRRPIPRPRRPSHPSRSGSRSSP